MIGAEYVEGADDGRRRRRRSATKRGAFSGNPAALVDDLTLPQRAAVEHRGGPLLIVAGAGSGKTRVLTRRIAHLMATGDAPPWGILAITFTNKAADEMRAPGGRAGRRRRPTKCGSRPSTRPACAFCAPNADRLGYRRAFTVYDDTDSRRLIEMITAELGFDQKRLPSRAVQGVISQAKSELIDFESFREEARSGPDPFRKRIAEIYAQYQHRLHAANALDFDDLLMVTANLLQAFDDVRAAYQERFRHILVDEFQDTNHAQNQIVKLLGEAHGNVCVVGDSDQSVYRWRGADIRNILEFERAFPNVTTIMLEQNFRSTQTILDAANAVIANNVGRQPKELFTVGDAGGPIKRYRAEDERDEASWVSGEILRLHASDGPVLGRRRRLLPDQRAVAPARDVHEVQRHPLQGGGRGQVLRPQGDQGHPGLRAGPGQPRRRGVRPAHRQRPQARHRGHLGRPAWPPGPRSKGVHLQRRHRPRRGGRPQRQGAQGGRGAGQDAGRAAARWCRRSTRPTSCSWWPTAPATWPSWWPSTRTRRTGGSRTWPSWPRRPATSTT